MYFCRLKDQCIDYEVIVKFLGQMLGRYDVIVIGGGHAGIEASVAAARMGCSTLLVSQDFYSIGRLSCNPSIGGSAKGHLVREIDALGGQMPFIADRSGLLFKMLNRSKGPAVWSPRSQNDKDLYPLYAQQLLSRTKNLTVAYETVDEIVIDHDTVVGVRTESGENIRCSCVVLCSGTFLNGVLHTGKEQRSGGRIGENASTSISDLLNSYGLERGRLKTGTPPRIFAESIDYSKTEVTRGDDQPQPFSRHSLSVRNTMCCYMTHTHVGTHEILQQGFADSPMYSGRITGAGPRYCPSIEDKISRFVERSSHQIVLEPEGLSTNTVYVNGFSTSLPADVQLRALRTIPGLEACQIQRLGYAVEYDFFFPYQLRHSLESKAVAGLFFAGQINGTSGYEEAASQGLVAGINAAHRVFHRGPFTLSRSDSYIGVMIDDLVNKNTEEPYRVFTSLAEYRLILRQDNADERLLEKGHEIGLINTQDLEKFNVNTLHKKHLRDFCDTHKLTIPTLNEIEQQNSREAEKVQNAGQEKSTSSDKTQRNTTESKSITELAKRPEVDLAEILNVVFDGSEEEPDFLRQEIIQSVAFDIKYEGYVKRMKLDIEQFRKAERKQIPLDFDFTKVNSLSTEALQKLKRIRPETIGQASRIAGVSATDISILTLYLTKSS